MSSPNISFSEVPSSIRKPGKYFEINTQNANSALPANRQKVVVLAQKLASGTAAAGVPLAAFNTAQIQVACGKGSIAHIMTRDAIRANRNISLYIVPVNDSASTTKAVRTLTIVGSPTSNGTIVFWVNAQRFELVVEESETINSIALRLKAIFEADIFFPFTVTVSSGVLTLTGISSGTLCSKIPIKIDDSGAVGTAISLTETTPGAGDPDLESTLAGISSERFHIVASSLNDATNVGYLKSWITTQSNAIEKKAGRVHYAHDVNSTISGSITSSLTANDGRLTSWYYRDSLSAPFSIAAACASIDAFEEDPARPLNGLKLNGIGVPLDSTKFFSNTEIEALLWGGVSPILPSITKSDSEIVRWITTYTQNSSGTPDPTLLEGTTFKVLDYVRDAVVQRLEARFPRSKKSARILDQIRTEVLDVLYRLEALEILEDVEFYKDLLIVEKDLQDDYRANVKIPTAIVKGLHVIGGVIDLIL